jgi:hypothetical protein
MKSERTKWLRSFKVSEEASKGLRVISIKRDLRQHELLREIVERYVEREAGRKGKAR